MPLARAVAASDALAERSAVSAIETASSASRTRRAPMKDPTSRVRLAQFLFVQGKKALLRRHGCARLERLAEPRTTHEAAGARRADELAVLDEDRAAQKHELGRAGHLGALVEVVVAFRVVRGRRDRLPPLGVEDDEVGVGPDRHRPLARVEAE